MALCWRVEEAIGVAVPEPALAARAVLLEIERLYNHVADIGALCMDVGFGILNVHAQRVREELLRARRRGAPGTGSCAAAWSWAAWRFIASPTRRVGAFKSPTTSPRLSTSPSANPWSSIGSLGPGC